MTAASSSYTPLKIHAAAVYAVALIREHIQDSAILAARAEVDAGKQSPLFHVILYPNSTQSWTSWQMASSTHGVHPSRAGDEIDTPVPLHGRLDSTTRPHLLMHRLSRHPQPPLLITMRAGAAVVDGTTWEGGETPTRMSPPTSPPHLLSGRRLWVARGALLPYPGWTSPIPRRV
jgi:hypothetical protein